MCKVMMVTGITNETRQSAIKFIKEMGKDMSIANRDGLGYAAVTSTGELFGERWTNNEDAFVSNENVSITNRRSAKDVFGEALSGSYSHYNSGYSEPPLRQYNSFGNVNDGWKDIVAITLHTRFATTPKGIGNTHPFLSDDTSLIHNGVINNHQQFEKVSTCDSEALLISYLNNCVSLTAENIQHLANDVSGYYACGVFSRDANGDRIMDVFKGNHANLTVTWVDNLNSFVFTTSEKDVSDVSKRLKFTHDKSETLKEGHLLRLNPVSGELILRQEFKVPGVNHSTNNSYNNSYSKGYANNVVDVSTKGRVRDITTSKLSLLELPPSTRKLSSQEIREMMA